MFAAQTQHAGSQCTGSEVWSASARLRADAAQVLRALTDPEAIALWAPVSFEVQGLAGARLRAGSCERVSGSIAGIGAAFDVHVQRADECALELSADGPVALDVLYTLHEQGDGVLVEANVALRRGRGLAARVLRGAVAAMLSAGALGRALARLEDALCAEPDLLAA